MFIAEFILSLILIIASMFMGPNKITGGAVPNTVICLVGEQTDGKWGKGYDARFEFEIMRNDEFIRPILQQGFLFDKYVVIAAWPYARRTVLDIGANIGTFAVPFATRAKRVLAFEPQQQMYKLLCNNIRRNSVKVKTYNDAVGHKMGTVHLSSQVSDGASVGQEITKATGDINFGGIQLGEGGEQCKMITIDSLKLDDVDLIKVDVEGAEPLVFYGAQETIRRCRPVIIYEKNIKRITDEMRRDMQLGPEADFDIDTFTRSLGYECIVELPHQNYMLLPPGNCENERYEPREPLFGYKKAFLFKKRQWA